MPFVVNTPLVEATSQNYKFDECHITGGSEGALTAVVSFLILDQNGNKVSATQLTFSGAAFNTFWSAFNSGTYLYSQLADSLSLPEPAPLSMESDFQNNV